MDAFAPLLRDPASLRVESLDWPDAAALRFGGFGPEAFALLERLRENPHIGQYRADKPEIERFIQMPFKRYRDDLVVNWVLPNRLNFETERNVFSRLLKNDFGAGGCHHHLWMSFYRPERRRLSDPQLAHSLSPDGLTVGLFIGAYMKKPLRAAQAHMASEPRQFLALLNPLLQSKNWVLAAEEKGRGRGGRQDFSTPLEALPEGLIRSEGFWIRTLIPTDEVIRSEGSLVLRALEAVRAVWPLYHFLVDEV